MIDNKTTNYNFPLPNAENTLLEDVSRISSAITNIDSEINSLNTEISSIDSEISSLNSAVNTKLTAGSLKTINNQSIIGDGNIEIVTELKTINGESLQGQGNITIQGSKVCLKGNYSNFFVGEKRNFEISNYNSFSTYSITANHGECNLLDNIITYIADDSYTGAVQLNITCDGVVNTFNFNINGSGISAPVFLTPSTNNMEVGTPFVAIVDTFQSIGEQDTHESTTWQLATDANFENIVQQSINDHNNKLSFTFSQNLTHNTIYYIRVKFSGLKLSDSNWAYCSVRTNNLLGTKNTIGVPGTQGFGVACVPDIDLESITWLHPMTGSDDIASDNYGNYETDNGSIMVCIPKFYYRRGSENSEHYQKYGANCIDIAGADVFINEEEANSYGYALPRAFIDEGIEKPYFFIDKYMCSKDGNASCKSIANAAPISLYQTTSGTWTRSQGMTNCTGILADAITLSRARGGGRFQCQSVFMNAALQMLIDAHAQAVNSNAFCAWYDPSGVSNFPKGCNNNALADCDDSSVTYASAGDSTSQKPKTRAITNFNKTTHNGQACGVADLNGMLYEVLIGVTNAGSNSTDTASISNSTAYVLKRSAKLADLTGGYNSTTDAWGTAETLATRYDLVTDFFIGTNGSLSGKVGNGVNQVFSGEIDGSETEYLRANCGYVKTTDSVSSTGTNQYGLDQYNEYNCANLVVLGSYYWITNTDAGAFCRGYDYRGIISTSYGFRAAAYN